MRAILSISKREVNSYFDSPVAYIVLGVFLLFSGYFYFSTFFIVGISSLRNFFGIIPLIFVVFAPALTMRFIAEERKMGTIELLLTLPVRPLEVVLGKFFAGLTIVIVALLGTLPYVVTAYFVTLSGASFDFGQVLGGYVGLLFMASAFISIGLLCSSFTTNQIVSFVLSLTLCFLLYFIDRLAFIFPAASSTFFQNLSADYHFMAISRGIIDSRDILYYVNLTAFCLLATVLVIRHDHN